ncbi:MAG: hypothetical protein KDD25_04000 [Bdellovibrionales bacterium]|nr:hypothetical protein [Bdellovibrionales bacterium]
MIFLLSAGSVWAGPTREATIPNAEVTPQGFYRVEVETIRPMQKEGYEKPATDRSNFGVTYGTRTFGLIGIELGLDWQAPTEASLPEALMLNAKVSTTTLEEKGWGGAFGVHSLGFKTDTNDYNILYGVFENKFWDALYIALGGYAGNDELLVDNEGGESNRGAMFGLWYKIQTDGRGRMGLEWLSGRSFYGTTQISLSAEMDKGLYGYISIMAPNNREIAGYSALFRISVDL